MNELNIIDFNGQLVTDSREVAEMVGKQHSNLMRDIHGYKEILDQNSNLNSAQFFIEHSYKNENNQTYPCYLLTRKGCDMVANKMTGEKGILFTAAYVTRFEEIERQLTQPKLPTTYKEALLALVEEVERSEQLQLDNQIKDQQIAEMQPKVTYVDTVLQCTDLLTTTQIADDYGMSAQRFNKLLHEQGIQYKQSGQWLLYAKYKGEGYTKSDTIPYKRTDGSEGVSILTKWTQKGRLFLYETLKVNDILPTMEQIKLTLIDKQGLEASTPERMN